MRYNHQVKIIIIIFQKVYYSRLSQIMITSYHIILFTNIIMFQKHIDLDTVMWLISQGSHLNQFYVVVKKIVAFL